MATRKLNVSVGDRVAYSRSYLRSIACHAGCIPRARGTVLSVKWYGDFPQVTVAWDRDRMGDAGACHPSCLVRVAEMHLEHD